MGAFWDDFKNFLRASFIIIKDGIMLIVWLALQGLVYRVIGKIGELSDIDQWLFVIFKFLFTVVTFIGLAILLYTDIRLLIIQCKRQIEEA